VIPALAAGVLVAALGGLVLVLRSCFVAVRVEGDSMAPALSPGDRVLVRRTRLDRVRRGQVVVLAPPAEMRSVPGNPPWMIKRAVALAGDPIPASREEPGQRVPPGQVFVLGDNSARSFDSRKAGCFPASALLGVVVRVLRDQPK
jgi:signal peptidase I